MVTLEVRDSSGGYNTREEPRSLAKGECMALVNAFPGSPSPQIRPGCSHWGRGALGAQASRTGTLVEMIEFRLSERSFIIEVLTNEVRAYREAGATGDTYAITDSAGTPIPGCRIGSIVSYVRVDDAVVANSNDPSWRWIFEFDGAKIVARATNILRPSATMTIARGIPNGRITPGWYTYSWTLVNRGDSIGATRLDQYAPGKLESWEDSSQRVTKEVTIETSLAVTISWSGAIDPQATHVRVYRTDAAISEDTVQGLTLHWVGDVAISGSSVSFVDQIQVSEGDFSPETSDLDDMPPSAVIYYHNGRMWIGGDRGIFFHSTPFASSSTTALKSVTMFSMALNFVKVSSDSTEQATAIGVANNDLYLNTDRSVGFLRDGDPTNKIQIISSTLGCPFYRTMTEWDQILAWLSPIGPVFAQNGYVDKMEKFKAGEVWLFNYQGKGFFHDKTKVARGEVTAFRYMGAWWISGGGKTIGFFESEDKRITGALEIEFADPEMRIDRVAVIDNETVVFDRITRPAWTSGSTVYPWRFLNQDWKTDAGWFFTVKQTFKRLYFMASDPSKVSEPYDVRMYASFTDNGELRINIRGDLERIAYSFRYDQRGRDHLQQSQDGSNETRFVLQQSIPAVGKRASFYDISWAKMMRPPFDFTCWGARLRVIPRRGIPGDSVSISQPDNLPLDQGLALVDSTGGIGASP